MLRVRYVQFLQKRWKHKKDHWSNLKNRKFPKDRALENFDDFYGSVFGIRWKNMRVALLTKNKYIALVNNFGDTEDTIKQLEENGAINVRAIQEATFNQIESENHNVMNDKTIYKLESRLAGFVEKHVESEIASIYPKDSPETSIPEKIIFNAKTETKELKSSTTSETVDYKKPLAQALSEDTSIDVRRIVDPDFGPGALYEFIPATRIKGMEDWIPESDHYKYYSNTNDFPFSIEMEKNFSYPDYLHLFTYEKANISGFIQPYKCVTGVLSHYLMDGASILPPLMLDIQKGDKVLDACAAPGGKSLLMLQTMYPDMLVCNDVQESRVNRIWRVMHEYIIDFNEKWHGKRCQIMQNDARIIDHYETYDRILVDVPCTNDRHSVTEDDNNIFKPSRIKERLRIPELQASILANCIRMLKPGGTLVYSTCTLSPIQNDGVIHMSLQRVFQEHGIVVTIKDLSFLMQQFAEIFKFEHPKGLKYGQMVTPFLPANFGPMYFCKITRNK